MVSQAQRLFISLVFVLYASWAGGQDGVQINEIIHTSNLVEIKNYGSSSVDVSGYWLCTWPSYIQIENLSCGDDLVLAPGEIIAVVVFWNLNPADGELALYIDSNFENASSMVDYVEWGSSGHHRSPFAQTAGLWTSGDFVPDWSECASLEYDGMGNGSAHWLPQDNPSSPCMENTLNGCAALPLELLSFSAITLDAANLITWTTTGEEYTEIFVVERSGSVLDTFSILGIVDAAGGATAINAYALEDNRPFGRTYYRLRISDLDGSFTYSPIVSVVRSDIPSLFVRIAYPVPVFDVLTLEIESANASIAQIHIIDILGKVVTDGLNIELSEGISTQFIDTSHLKSGIHTLLLTSGDLQIVEKFVVQ